MTPAAKALITKLAASAARGHAYRWVQLRGADVSVAWNTIENGHGWIDIRVGNIAKITNEGREALARETVR